ncbi:MAG: phosphodiesterase, partial [Methylophilaceae bacterium]
GVVIDQNEKSLLAPKVKVFYSIKSGTRLKPQVLDMSLAMTRDRIVSHEESGEWDIPDLHELWSGWTLPA